MMKTDESPLDLEREGNVQEHPAFSPPLPVAVVPPAPVVASTVPLLVPPVPAPALLPLVPAAPARPAPPPAPPNAGAPPAPVPLASRALPPAPESGARTPASMPVVVIPSNAGLHHTGAVPRNTGAVPRTNLTGSGVIVPAIPVLSQPSRVAAPPQSQLTGFRIIFDEEAGLAKIPFTLAPWRVVVRRKIEIIRLDITEHPVHSQERGILCQWTCAAQIRRHDSHGHSCILQNCNARFDQSLTSQSGV